MSASPAAPNGFPGLPRELCWPASRLGEALEALAHRVGGAARMPGIQNPPQEVAAACDADEERMERWVASLAARMGIEAEPVEASYAEIERLVLRGGPAILRLPGRAEHPFLVLVRAGRREVVVLGPDLALARIGAEAVCTALRTDIEAPLGGEIERILTEARIAPRRRPGARAALLAELCAAARIRSAWILRADGARAIEDHAREARLPRLLVALICAYTLHFALWIVSWWLLGRGALDGRLDAGWLIAWGLVLATLIPFRLLATYAAGVFSIRAGTMLKRRLLFGALKLKTDEIREWGAGQMLGRVLESDVVEQMAVTGGFLGFTALIEILLGAFVLAHGAGGWLSVLALAAWTAAAGFLCRSYLRRRRAWTEARLGMTNELVERMVGHRTRIAQEPRERWNAGEDEALERYVGLSGALDRNAVRLQTIVPRGWCILGILSLAPAFVAGAGSAAALAVGIGGVLLAFQAFRDLSDGLERIVAAAIAWEQVRPFWEGAARAEALGAPESLLSGASARADACAAPDGGGLLLDARDLVFRHRRRAEPVLRGVNLRIHVGDRILLEGPSGGGKSTLAAVLAAARAPDSGILLVRGLDQETLGREGWRRHVAIAPQFHENHVVLGTLAFNALMGRRWPPRDNDLAEAEQVLRGLDLGPLLDRMPSGIMEMVGETGWQLSHGEKSRLYIARALLGGADLHILDESFAALDPRTLDRTLAFVLKRARTVLVIAHP